MVQPRLMLPAYAFIKTHKVGGTTVMRMLRSTLRETQNATLCDNSSQTTRVLSPFPRGCRACLTHGSYRQIADALRLPGLEAPQEAVRKMCPFWVPGRHVHTMVMLRDPVDKLYSRYHYERSNGWCRKRAAALGLSGCASDHYAFVKWTFVSPMELQARRLYKTSDDVLHAETVMTLGGRDGGVVQALQVLKKIEVVGLTHRFNETLCALSISWGLPLILLKQELSHANKGTPRPPLNSSVSLALRKQGYWLQQEQVLYNYASKRLTQTMAMSCGLCHNPKNSS